MVIDKIKNSENLIPQSHVKAQYLKCEREKIWRGNYE